MDTKFATYTNFPEGSITMPSGLNPVAMAAGVAGVRLPVQELTVNIENVFAGFPFNT